MRNSWQTCLDRRHAALHMTFSITLLYSSKAYILIYGCMSSFLLVSYFFNMLQPSLSIFVQTLMRKWGLWWLVTRWQDEGLFSQSISRLCMIISYWLCLLRESLFWNCCGWLWWVLLNIQPLVSQPWKWEDLSDVLEAISCNSRPDWWDLQGTQSFPGVLKPGKNSCWTSRFGMVLASTSRSSKLRRMWVKSLRSLHFPAARPQFLILKHDHYPSAFQQSHCLSCSA